MPNIIKHMNKRSDSSSSKVRGDPTNNYHLISIHLRAFQKRLTTDDRLCGIAEALWDAHLKSEDEGVACQPDEYYFGHKFCRPVLKFVRTQDHRIYLPIIAGMSLVRVDEYQTWQTLASCSKRESVKK